MTKTRQAKSAAVKKVVKARAKTQDKGKVKGAEQPSSSQESNAENETAYERLLRKVNENKRSAAKEGERSCNTATKKAKTGTQDELKSKQSEKRAAECRTSFKEENNYVDMGVSGDFLSDDEDLSLMEVEASQNNNATRSDEVAVEHSKQAQTSRTESHQVRCPVMMTGQKLEWAQGSMLAQMST